MKYLGYFSLFALAIFAGCQSEPDTLEDTRTPSALELPPIDITITDVPRSVLKEELFWRWKITALDEWEDGGYIWFTDDDGRNAMFHFKCNEMTLAGEMSDEGVWLASQESYGTTEAFCAGEKGEQDKALLSLMFGPSEVERVGSGPNTIRFSNSDHAMTLERQWSDGAKLNWTKQDLFGEWDVIRFDDFVPKSRLNSEGKRSAYVDFYDDEKKPNSLTTILYIGCNYSGNTLQLDLRNKLYQLSDIAQRHGQITTQKGCPPDLQKRDESFFTFMEKSPNIERLGEHRLRLWTDAQELILEKKATRQSRNAIQKFETIHGAWSITMVSKAGLGLGGSFFAPEPIIISKDKIQYGELDPYLKSPRIEGGKIVGTVVGDFERHDCYASRSFSLVDISSREAPIATEPNAICFVLDTLLGQPVAEPMGLTNFVKLTSGDYGLTLKRLEE